MSTEWAGHSDVTGAHFGLTSSGLWLLGVGHVNLGALSAVPNPDTIEIKDHKIVIQTYHHSVKIKVRNCF